jgi:hypothetical protein
MEASSKNPVSSSPRHRIDDLFPLFKEIQAGQNLLNDRLTRHMEGEERHIQEINATLKDLQEGQSVLIDCRLKAFPKDKNGDPDILGHCADHETRMLEAETTKKFWQRQRERVADKAMDALLMGVVAIGLFTVHTWYGEVIVKMIKKAAGS